MEQNEYNKLVAEYGEQLARKALAWFLANVSAETRKHLWQAQFCIDNEYLWRA